MQGTLFGCSLLARNRDAYYADSRDLLKGESNTAVLDGSERATPQRLKVFWNIALPGKAELDRLSTAPGPRW
jgi:hypothetical protein